MEQRRNNAAYIEAAKQGDTSAFMHLMRQYQPMVFTIVAKVARSRADAEDITQEVFIKAFNGIGSFREKSEFSTWLYRIAYNTTVSELRKKKFTFVSYDGSLDLSDDDDNLASASKEQLVQCLEQVLEGLPPDEAFLIYLFYRDEQSIEQISHITNQRIGNIKVKLHRIRQKLKVELSKLTL